MKSEAFLETNLALTDWHSGVNTFRAVLDNHVGGWSVVEKSTENGRRKSVPSCAGLSTAGEINKCKDGPAVVREVVGAFHETKNSEDVWDGIAPDFTVEPVAPSDDYS